MIAKTSRDFLRVNTKKVRIGRGGYIREQYFCKICGGELTATSVTKSIYDILHEHLVLMHTLKERKEVDCL